MSKNERIARLYSQTGRLGLSAEETSALVRIERTLHRWSEMECGDDRGCIERDGDSGDGVPYWRSADGRHGHRIPDREAGALRRLARVMELHPNLVAYHQGDPRGCALYILSKHDIPEGTSIDSIYSRGVAICH
jgi:hypothetical protein